MFSHRGMGLIAIIAILGGGIAGYKHQDDHIHPSDQVNFSPEYGVTTENVPHSIDIIGHPRPEFSMADVAGHRRDVTEWDGQVLVINFWATWCPPCLKEIPEFIHLQNKYADQGLQFIGIALQKPIEVMDFIQAYGMNYPVFAGEMEVVDLTRAYGNHLGGLPYTVIIDRHGIVNSVKQGPLSMTEAEAIISRLL